MTSYEGKYDKFKISLSLGIDKLYISSLDEVTYDLYDLDITNMIFNNDNIKLEQLFNIIKKGIEKSDINSKISLELSTKYLRLKILCQNEYFTLKHNFDLIKHINDISVKELKKELFELKKEFIQYERNNTNVKSIIPIIKFYIDEYEVEDKYKWFLDYLKTIIKKDYTIDELYKQYDIPNNSINGKCPLNDLEWNIIKKGWWSEGHNTEQTIIIPEKKLYYYLKKRKIQIWKHVNQSIKYMYIE